MIGTIIFLIAVGLVVVITILLQRRASAGR